MPIFELSPTVLARIVCTAGFAAVPACHARQRRGRLQSHQVSHCLPDLRIRPASHEIDHTRQHMRQHMRQHRRQRMRQRMRSTVLYAGHPFVASDGEHRLIRAACQHNNRRCALLFILRSCAHCMHRRRFYHFHWSLARRALLLVVARAKQQ